MIYFHYWFMVKLDKTLIKLIWCGCNCKFDGWQYNSVQKWNNDSCQCECENLLKHCLCKKYYLLNRSACPCQKNEYLGSIIDDSVVTCDETIEPTKTIFKILMIKKQPAKWIISTLYLIFYELLFYYQWSLKLVFTFTITA